MRVDRLSGIEARLELLERAHRARVAKRRRARVVWDVLQPAVWVFALTVTFLLGGVCVMVWGPLW